MLRDYEVRLPFLPSLPFTRPAGSPLHTFADISSPSAPDMKCRAAVATAHASNGTMVEE